MAASDQQAWKQAVEAFTSGSAGGRLELRGKGSLQPGLAKICLDDAALVEVLEAIKDSAGSLIALDLRYNAITDTGCSKLADLIKRSTSLTDLLLDCNDFGAAGAETLAQALQVNESITTLSMRGNKIGKAGNIHLAAVLQINTSLQHLDVAQSDLDVDGILAFCTVLRQNTSLLELNMDRPLLKSCQEDSAVSVADMLTCNSGLRVLSLEKFDVGDYGVARLGEALLRNSTLEELNLTSNKITRDGARSLTNTCLSQGSLKRLTLDRNRVEDEGAMSLSDAMLTPACPLTFLGVAHNNIGGAGIVALTGAFSTAVQSFSIWGNPGLCGVGKAEATATQAVAELLATGKQADVRARQVDGVWQIAEVVA